MEDMTGAIFAQIRPFVWYRNVDLADELGIDVSVVRRATRHLEIGGVVESEKQGRTKVYLTKQSNLFQE